MLPKYEDKRAQNRQKFYKLKKLMASATLPWHALRLQGER
jgi:hypothetical protein